MSYGVCPSQAIYIYIYTCIYMPLVYFVLFKTTLRKTFWPYMKILSKTPVYSHPRQWFLHFTFYSHLYFIFYPYSFYSTLFYFIHLYFTIFCFISLGTFRIHFVFILLHFASFCILIGPRKNQLKKDGDKKNKSDSWDSGKKEILLKTVIRKISVKKW